MRVPLNTLTCYKTPCAVVPIKRKVMEMVPLGNHFEFHWYLHAGGFVTIEGAIVGYSGRLWRAQESTGELRRAQESPRDSRRAQGAHVGSKLAHVGSKLAQ
eukprot:7141299-Karenia_brevis.AAC.1